jgi:hypothetical protein
MMRPGSTKEDIPSAYNIKAYLRKEFVEHMKEITEEIKVSPNMFVI